MSRTSTPPLPFLPYGRQQIDEDDIAAVVAALRSDALTGGPRVNAFEEAFAARVGARYAVVCANGTAALHLATLALKLGPNDWAIVPSVTFLATANAVRYVDADVKFADVDPQTGLMTGQTLEQAIHDSVEGKLAAILPVHLNGLCADMETLSEIARRHDLAIIEDACHAIGATYSTRSGETFKVGSCRHSDMTVFSLHPVKTIAMGEGGVITTNDPALYERLKQLRNHGMVREPEHFTQPDEAFAADGTPNPWYYEMQEPGFNYRASDIHCALGLSQLQKLDQFLGRRRILAEAYDAQLAALSPLVRPVPRIQGYESGWHLYVVHIDFQAAGITRATLMNRLRQADIGTQVHYLPVHRQPYYRQRYGHQNLLGADQYYAHCLSLPLFPAMTDHDITRVVDTLTSLLAR